MSIPKIIIGIATAIFLVAYIVRSIVVLVKEKKNKADKNDSSGKGEEE